MLRSAPVLACTLLYTPAARGAVALMRRAPVCHRRSVIAVGCARLVRMLRSDARVDVGVDKCVRSTLRAPCRCDRASCCRCGAARIISLRETRPTQRAGGALLPARWRAAQRCRCCVSTPRGRQFGRRGRVMRAFQTQSDTPLRPRFGYALSRAVPLPVPP